MSLSLDIERGRLAADVLNNPVYVGAYEAIEKEIYSAWQSAREPSEREHLWRMQQCLSKLQSCLRTTMDSGTVAVKQLQSDERRGLMSRLASGR